MWACLLPQAWGRCIPGDPAFSKRFLPPCCSEDMLGKGHSLQAVRQWVPRWLTPVGMPEAPPFPLYGHYLPRRPTEFVSW